MANISQITKTTETDENGNVKTSSESVTFNNGSEPPYIKLYLQDITYLNSCPQGSDKVLYSLLGYLNLNNSRLIVNKAVRDEIAEEHGIGEGRVRSLISEFAKKNILLKQFDDKTGKQKNGVYKLNPFIFGFGKWGKISQERREDVAYTVSYHPETGARIVKFTLPKITASEDGFLPSDEFELVQEEDGTFTRKAAS